ncbi:LOW QUALITY PROTEIN: pentatricopeptide repeat-containing protein At4g38150-like [Juglans regia]|uniref:LOW QUALITY PROTEIN: pentatricopeptide repeat-containing protein At4g38150-like n=1 Tax=Juglans regia TaxID=51240 RepID=A0A2I4FBR9_JUGRE|nr:LOW QUALITY PROTEIN: pentatricopeptide repeat-containing protein At4g38150-like [Juglans regia]
MASLQVQGRLSKLISKPIPYWLELRDGKADTSSSPLPQDADEIFKKLKETGLNPNAVAMLDGLCKDGLVQEAMKFFGLMREKGTIPKVVIYAAIVEGFCKAHKFDDARPKRIFKKMQNNGISPNAFSYSVLTRIQGVYQFEELEDAFAFCVEMLEAGHSPYVPTFLGLVARLCLQKGVEEARTVIATLTQKDFFINRKAIKEYMEKKPTHPSIREAIFGNDTQERPFQF